MQVCPFCNVDRGDRPLNEGRCPNCGIVLDWQDVEGEAAVPVDPKSVPTEAPTASRKESTDVDDASSRVEPSPSSENLPVQETATEESPKTVRKSLQKGSWPTQDIVELWRHSISDVSKPQQTLKGVTSAGTVSDSIFSIQQREIRSGDVDVGVPVDYQLLEVIGQGGVGVVYAARQSSIDRMVAVKMLREEYRSRSDHRDKFLAEAVVTGELDHPNIVPIYDLGRSVNGELFYSMKNVVGTPWDRVITQKSLRENLDILLKVADAVAFAHSRGVVHRDLKPENVMLGEYGEVLVMDWGIALPTAGFRKDSGILRSQAMGGTPAYMAPEMATGPLEKIGPPADVYLLGAILFEILTGKPPHFGNDVMDCVLNASQNIIQETEVTGELMDIAKLAMSTVVRRRYRSVQDFQNAIRLYQSHSESITLSDNAERDLASATETKDYQELSRIVFAFREALSLWKENTAAEDGLIRAQLAYATTALDKGDFDLGLSILDRDRQEHRMLVRKLEEAQKDREVKQARFQAIRKLAIALAGFIFVAGSIAMVVILALFQQVSSSYSTLQAQSFELQEAKKTADKEKNKAIEEGDNARKQKEKAEVQKELAENRRKDAEVARLESVAQRMRAEESSYSAELGLVSASLDQNGFSIAANVLERQLQSASKSKLRHWEWGHNWFLVHGTTGDDPEPPVQSIKRDSILVAIDSHPSGSLVALGLADGTIEVWGDSRTEPLYKVQHGTKLTHLDMDATGRFLVSCGMDGEKHLIHVWRLGPKGEPVVERSLQHGSLIETVSFSNGNDPSLIVWSDRQRVGRISRWRDGSEVATLLGHLEPITSVVFSPDNRWVASSSLDGSVRIWNSQTGEQVQKFSEHQGSVMSVAFAPDGKKIASAGADRKVLLWDLDTTGNLQKEFENTEKQVKGEKLAPPKFEAFMGHTATVRSVRFSQDGQLLVSTANDNVVNVWDMAPSSTTNPVIKELRKQGRTSREKGEPLVRLRGHGGWVTSCCVLQEGATLLTASDDTTWKRWRVLGYREQYRLGDGQVPILDGHFSPDGKAIATAHLDGTINLWDANTGKSISVLKEGHEYLTNKAKFAKEGRILVTAAGDNSIRLWDVEKGSQFAVLERSGRNAVFSISADSQWLASGGDESGFIVWNLNDLDEEPKRLRPWNQAAQDSRRDFDEPTSMAISRSGDYVFVGNKNGNCEFWSNKLGKMLFQEMGHSDAIVASFFLDSNMANGSASAVVLTASMDGSVAWWNAETGKELSRKRLSNFVPIQKSTLSIDGKFLACSTTLEQGNSKIWIWNLETGKRLKSGH